MIYPWLRPVLRYSRSLSGSALKNVLNDYWPLHSRTKSGKIYYKSASWCQTCIMMKTAVIMSQVHHSEKWSAVYDCLVLLVFTSVFYLLLQQILYLLGVLTDYGKDVMLVGGDGCGKSTLVAERIRMVCSGEVAEVLELSLQTNRYTIHMCHMWPNETTQINAILSNIHTVAVCRGHRGCLFLDLPADTEVVFWQMPRSDFSLFIFCKFRKDGHRCVHTNWINT